MKQKYLIVSGLFVSAILSSCGESELAPELASVTVVNAAINTGAIQVNYFGETINWSAYNGANVYYGSSGLFNLSPSNASFKVVSSTDTLNVLMDEDLALKAGTIYSYYLVGQSPNVESMIVQELPLPKSTYPDSTFNVRFINLSPDNIGVKLNLTDTPSELFDNVGFKQATDFVRVNAPSGLWDIGFEVRNTETDEVLATFRQYVDFQAPYGARFHPITLFLYGNSASSYGIGSINNY